MLGIKDSVLALDFDTAAAFRLILSDNELKHIENAAMNGEELTVEAIRLQHKATGAVIGKVSAETEYL